MTSTSEKLEDLTERLNRNRRNLEFHIAIAQDANASLESVIEANKQISKLWAKYFEMDVEAMELGLNTVADLTSSQTRGPVH